MGNSEVEEPCFEENTWKGEAALCIHNLSQGRRVKIKYYLNDTLLGEAPEEVKISRKNDRR